MMKKPSGLSRVSRAATALILAVVLFCFTGCFDLGMFKDGEEEGYADYYAAFGDVYTVSESGTHSYDIKDSLFNSSTVNDLTWEDEDDAVEEEAYTFIAIPCERDMNVELVSFSLCGDVACDLEAYVYVVDSTGSIPTPLFYDETGESDDDDEDDDEDEEEKPDPSVSILPLEDADASTSWNSEKDKFTSVSVSLKKDGKGLPVEDGQVLLIYIANNTRYGFLHGKTRCSFSFLNLLIRAVDPEGAESPEIPENDD